MSHNTRTHEPRPAPRRTGTRYGIIRASLLERI